MIARPSTGGLALWSLVFAAFPAVAGTFGILEGTVRERSSGELLPGVNVSIVALQRGAITDARGRFLLQQVPSGIYEVRFSLVGYTPVRLKNVEINPGLSTRLTVNLDPAEVTLDEIVIYRETPPIQKDVTGTTYIIRGEDILLLPLNDISEALALKPGVTLEGHVRGGRTSEVLYLIDGLPVQDVVSGGASPVLPISSIAGASMMTGGFEPEYGNALSGVVNIVTKPGATDHRFSVRLDRDTWFGGTQSSNATDAELFATGPILKEQLTYLAALHGLMTDTRWWQDFQYAFSSPVEQNLSAFGKLDAAITPTMKLGGQILYAHRNWRDYEFPWRYNLAGLPPEQRDANRLAVTFTHSPTDRFFYTASVSRFYVHSTIGGSSPADIRIDDPYRYDFLLQYVVGGQRGWWSATRQESYTLKADATLNAGGSHLLKAGGELTFYDLHSDVIKYEPRKTYFGKPLINEPQLDFGSTYTYQPLAGGVYIQDKIDLSRDDGIILNVGLRYDVLNPGAERPTIEAIPVSDDEYELTVAGTVPASVKHSVSPRIGAAMQLTEKGFLFINLGRYVQYPLFDYLYTGLDRIVLAGGIPALRGNPDLNPETATAYEISIKYSLPLDLVASATYFRKEWRNLVDSKTFIQGDSKLGPAYGFAEYVNNPNAEASGLEVTLTRERGDVLRGDISYTYMKTDGTSGSAYDGFYIAQYGLPPAKRVYPLSWDQRHTVKLAATVFCPWNMSIILVGQYHTGRPYTYYPTSTGFEAVDSELFQQNNRRMPSFALADLKVEQRLDLGFWPTALLHLYADIRNLFDTRNVLWMDSNGRIGGELSDPSAYAIGRRTRLGFRLEF